MNRADLTEKILDIKREKGWKWKTICEKIGGFSDTLIVGALLGQMKLTKPQAGKAAELFGLSKSEEALLNEVPMRGTGTPMPPTDPLIYRFYEMVMINGPAWKQLIEEEFGDGIMSAIDFDFQMERVANPKGDRVKITMSGKFLPYKYYGASGNVPEYGFKEDSRAMAPLSSPSQLCRHRRRRASASASMSARTPRSSTSPRRMACSRWRGGSIPSSTPSPSPRRCGRCRRKRASP